MDLYIFKVDGQKKLVVSIYKCGGNMIDPFFPIWELDLKKLNETDGCTAICNLRTFIDLIK